VVAKAVISYFNFEEADCAPTIELVEVIKGQRRKGIGRKMLEEIEGDMLDLGFNRIWATNIKSFGFWEEMGYEFDLEEASKFLG